MAEFKKKYMDGRKNNGGYRPGSGRPLSSARQIALEFGMEIITVKEFRCGQMRKVKKTRNEVMLDALFHLAHYERNRRATCLLLDLYLGKPTAPKNELDETV